MRIARLLIFFIGVCGLLKVPAANFSPEIPPGRGDSLDEYMVDVWTTEHGLPQNSVNSVAQTPDGYLWFTTFNGLARFDGVRFVVFDSATTPELRSGRLVRSCVDKEGALWIISEFNEVTRYANGKFTKEEAGQPDRGIYLADLDADGRAWFGSYMGYGFYHHVNGRFVQIFDGNLTKLARPTHLFPGYGNGELWTRMINDLIRIVPPDLKTAPAFGDELTGMGSDSTGKAVASTYHGVFRFDGERWNEMGRFPTEVKSGASIIGARDGTIWGANNAGRLWKTIPGGLREYKVSSVPVDFRCVFEDAENCIWAGTDGSGLFRLRPRVVQTVTPEQGLSANIVKSVTSDSSGKIWAMCMNGLNLIATDPLRVVGKESPGANNWVIQADREGYLWAGSWGSSLIRRRDGMVEHPLKNGNRMPGTCLAMHVDAKGKLWAAGDFGIFRLNGLAAEEFAPRAYDLESPCAITEDQEGRLYFGTRGSGILILQNGKFEKRRKSEGWASESVSALCADADGAIWIGSPNHGLARLKDGKIISLSEKVWDLKSVYGIIEDDFGYLWFTSNKGLVRAAREDLHACADGRSAELTVNRYSITDGLAATEFMSGVHPTACKGLDGKLWFATLHGVAMVDPKKVPVNTRPPPVHVEEFWVDDKRVELRSNETVTIGPGLHRLEVRFTATSFVAPQKMHFRAKLEGYEEEWNELGSQRAVTYNRVPPGGYQFRVIASNNDGVWNKSGATLAVVMLPHYWQTRWFAALIVFAFAAAAIGAYLQAVRAMERKRSAQREFAGRLMEVQEAERKRMAAELHDSLGQKLQLIRNRAQLAINNGEPAASLTEISGITNEAITEVRGITAALRPSELDEIGVRGAIEWMITNVTKASGLRILAEVDAIEGILTPINEMHLYRIVQETLNNIIKHSQATEATVEIKKNAASLIVSIFDNGTGFDPENLAPRRGPGGLGLTGIGERVRILSGTHVIDSKVGMGTRLIVTIPLPGL